MIRQRGFTLVEVLVVVGIVLLLAGLLFPLLARVRAKGQQAGCMSHQRQLAVTLLLWAQDHEETFPPSVQVWQTIGADPALLQCPRSPRDPIGYLYNPLVEDRAVTGLPHPDATFLTVDGIPGDDLDPHGEYVPRHQGKFIVSFADGHVELREDLCDGTIYFHVVQPNTGGSKSLLYRMAGDGSNIARVTSETIGDYTMFLSGSLDGRWLTLTAGDVSGTEDICRVDTGNGNVTRLISGQGHHRCPAFSPDGQHIVFTSRRDENWQLYSMDVDGGETMRLTNNHADDYAPQFSPDGERIVFTSGRDGNGEIYLMQADGSEQQRLTNSPEEDSFPTFSPDGRHIAFTTDPGDGRRTRINILDLEDRHVTQVTTGSITCAFSPDGARIAFAMTQDGQHADIYTIRTDGTGLRRLTTGLDCRFPAWIP